MSRGIIAGARSFVRDDRGYGMVEFAISSALFLLLLLGIIEFARAMWIQSSVTAASREGARYAAVRGSSATTPADAASVATYVQGRVPLSPLTVSPQWPSGKSPGSVVRVTVGYQYRPLVAIPLNRTLNSTSSMVIVY